MAINNAVNNNPQGKSNVYLSACLPELTVINNVTGTGNYYTCTFNTVNFNSYNAYNSSTGIWECPLDGYYQAQLNIQAQFNDIGTRTLQGIIVASFGGGSPLIITTSYAQSYPSNSTDQPFTLIGISPPLKMLAGFDRVHFELWGEGGNGDNELTISQTINNSGMNADAISVEILRLGK